MSQLAAGKAKCRSFDSLRSFPMHEAVESRGIPPIRQKADEWMGHPAFVEYAPVHLWVDLAFAGEGAEDDGVERSRRMRACFDMNG